MKKARMNISHFRFILSKLKIFGEIVTTIYLLVKHSLRIKFVSCMNADHWQLYWRLVCFFVFAQTIRSN